MSSTPIQQAKVKLPLFLLMDQLGLGEHTKKNGRCPFHDDAYPSFSVFKSGSSWFYKCHAGCGAGDEINFLEKYKGISQIDAIKLYLDMAGCAPLAHTFWRKSSEGESQALNWLDCVDGLGDEPLERLGNERWYSREFCLWLRENHFIGLFKCRIAFPVHNNGTVVGVHYRLEDGSWRYTPGTKATPLVIGALVEGDNVYVFESQWDAFAFMDKSGERGGVLITRGASNGGRLAELLPQGATVYCWIQNDAPGEKWANDVCQQAKAVKATVKLVRIPEPHKDLNDWTRAGATCDDLVNALVGAETLYTPCPLVKLLDTVVGILQRYVVFQYPEQAEVCALWAIHTWAFNAFDYTPYLSVFAAEKRSGKSRLLEVLSLLVRNARLTSGSTSAALIRSVDEDNPPTILLDEVDAVYSKKNDAEAENTRQFLNAGFRRGAKFLRCVGQGGAMEVKEFPAFCPKALSGIGRCLPDTVLDRSLPVELVRQSREERAERFREREAQSNVAAIRAELAAWVLQPGLIDTLRDARPALPEELTDRQQDYCEPLLAIADMAGGDWPGRSRLALIKLCSQEEDASLGVKLLADIKGIFDSKGANKLHTIDILNALVAIEDDRPWAVWWLDDLKHDKSEKPASRLAKLLKPYGTKQRPLKARPIRLSDKIARGYEIDDFKHAFEHYLPPPEKAVTSVTSVTYEGKPVTASDNVTAPGVTSDGYGGNGSGSDNLGNVTALSTNVTAPVAEGVTRNPLVERPFVTDVTGVTPFREGERDGAEDRLIEEAKRLFNAVPAGNP